MNIIFDIDGTLSIVGERLECLKEKDWDSFYERCGEDLTNGPIFSILVALWIRNNHSITFLTGRRESTRETTLKWLSDRGIDASAPGKLLMRPEGDKRHDTIVKPELLAQEEIVPDLVFEDRDAMVAYWRENGVCCVQVADGNF